MGIVHIIEGPVGAGKTTFAIRLSQKYGTPPLILDDWMVRLFKADRPEKDVWSWYAARKKRCIDQIWEVARGLLEFEINAIVELGLLQSEQRLEFCRRVKQAGFGAQIYILDAPIEERWRRVQQRNSQQGKTFSMIVSEDVFTLASQMWEPPSTEECARNNVEFVGTDGN